MNILFLKLNIGYLQVYGCRAYFFKYNILCFNKFILRAHIRYLVGYNLMNIFWVYILSEKKIIRIRDVKFNKQLLYNDLQPDFINLLWEKAN